MMTTISGTVGDDTLVGSAGADLFIFEDGHGVDIIQGFAPGEDVIDLSALTTGFVDFNAVLTRAFDISSFNGTEFVNFVLIETSFNNATNESSAIIIDGISVADLSASDFIFSEITGRLITGTSGNDSLTGDLGQDTLIGGAGGDSFDGGGGDDALDGGAGNDTLIGFSGTDTLTGGAGGDLFVFEADFIRGSAPIISDFTPGEDRIDVSSFGESLATFLDVVENSTEVGGDLVITIAPEQQITISDTQLSDLSATDFIFEGQSATGIETEGGSGSDTLDGTDADDTLDGGDGADTVRGGAGSDFINTGSGNDFANGGAGNDTISGDLGDDQIFAGPDDAGDDVFVGGDGGDTLGGGAGDDLLVGGSFDDGAVSQTGIVGSVGDGVDVIFGGAGNDTLLGGGFSDTVVDDGAFNPGEEVTTGTEVNTLFAGTGNDLVIGAAGNDTIGGGTGDDTLEGGDGNDTFFGGRGDDTDTGVNDIINGGGGNDTVFAGAGNDSVSGGAGNDELFNGGGTDTVDGGDGSDTLFGGGGDDFITGGTGADLFAFFGGNGNDTVTDFEVGTDSLELEGTAFDFTDLASVQAAASNATIDGASGLLIDTGGGDSVFLVGLTVDDLSSLTIIF